MQKWNLRAMTLALGLTLAFSEACAPDRLVAEDPEAGGDDDALLADAEPHSPNTLRLLKLRTYDGSGQTVHPDFAQVTAWPTPFLLVATPYTYGNSSVENPTLFSRGADFEWSPLDPTSNPIAVPTDRGRQYLSDPDIVAIPGTPELWVYYRQVDAKNTILLKRTIDGIRFTDPVTVVSGARQTIVSPTIVRRDSTHWRMWSVNAGADGCSGPSTTVELRRSRDGKQWSEPATVSLTQGTAFVWHIDVQWIPSRKEYWALYNVKTPGSCATVSLYLATSPDGITWRTYPAPLISAGVIPEFADVVYRSTFSYDPATDKIRFWYSGARVEGQQYVWQSAFDRRDRAEVFESISALPPSWADLVAPRVHAVVFDPP
jgi:hypothetical protein